MLNVAVKDDKIYVGERFSTSFQRTLRIPDDDKTYPLPPGLGVFPVRRVDDHPDCFPDTWKGSNHFFISMYRREALWLGFDGADWKPNAVLIGVGKINAISGQVWDETLCGDTQNYIVCPDQPWLDGINVGDGVIRQFVAVPLGLGYTIEAQLTGAEEFGGIQVMVYEPKPGRFPDQAPPEPELDFAMFAEPVGMVEEMGLGAGGQMKQKIYPDPHGVDTWDPENCASIFIHIVNSEQHRELLGFEPPPTPISAQTYAEYGLPWFDLYDEERGDLAPSEVLAKVKTIREQEIAQGIAVQEDAAIEVDESSVHRLHPSSSDRSGNKSMR